jgi:hypothetical protein
MNTRNLNSSVVQYALVTLVVVAMFSLVSVWTTGRASAALQRFDKALGVVSSR